MSTSILDVLSQQLGGDVVKQMSAQLGADEGTVNNAIAAALPMLIGGLARNSANPQGADALSSALARDHDGSILDDLVGFLGSGNPGAGPNILGHVFGGKTDAMASFCIGAGFGAECWSGRQSSCHVSATSNGSAWSYSQANWVGCRWVGGHAWP